MLQKDDVGGRSDDARQHNEDFFHFFQFWWHVCVSPETKIIVYSLGIRWFLYFHIASLPLTCAQLKIDGVYFWTIYRILEKLAQLKKNNKTLFGLDECNFNELPSNPDVLSNTFAQDNEIYRLKKTFLLVASWSLLFSSSLSLWGENESLFWAEEQKWEEQLCYWEFVRC